MDEKTADMLGELMAHHLTDGDPKSLLDSSGISTKDLLLLTTYVELLTAAGKRVCVDIAFGFVLGYHLGKIQKEIETLEQMNKG